jgi:hypothetical protein
VHILIAGDEPVATMSGAVGDPSLLDLGQAGVDLGGDRSVLDVEVHDAIRYDIL